MAAATAAALFVYVWVSSIIVSRVLSLPRSDTILKALKESRHRVMWKPEYQEKNHYLAFKNKYKQQVMIKKGKEIRVNV